MKANTRSSCAPKFNSPITAPQAADMEHRTRHHFPAPQILLSPKASFSTMTVSGMFISKNLNCPETHLQKTFTMLSFIRWGKKEGVNNLLDLTGLKVFSITPEEVGITSSDFNQRVKKLHSSANALFLSMVLQDHMWVHQGKRRKPRWKQLTPSLDFEELTKEIWDHNQGCGHQASFQMCASSSVQEKHSGPHMVSDHILMKQLLTPKLSTRTEESSSEPLIRKEKQCTNANQKEFSILLLEKPRMPAAGKSR